MNLNIELFSANHEYAAGSNYKKHIIVVSMLDEEIFRTEPFDDYPSEYQIDEFAEAAEVILGELIAERLAAKVKYSEDGEQPSV